MKSVTVTLGVLLGALFGVVVGVLFQMWNGGLFK